jgi:uncharacterized membrane protein HdeD (DUF308 family)
MISHEPFPLKTLGLWSVLVLCGLFTTYIIVIAIVSIWVGLKHLQQDGFWMPVLAGTLSITVVLWLFLRFSRFILNRMKEKDTINL